MNCSCFQAPKQRNSPDLLETWRRSQFWNYSPWQVPYWLLLIQPEAGLLSSLFCMPQIWGQGKGGGQIPPFLPHVQNWSGSFGRQRLKPYLFEKKLGIICGFLEVSRVWWWGKSHQLEVGRSGLMAAFSTITFHKLVSSFCSRAFVAVSW